MKLRLLICLLLAPLGVQASPPSTQYVLPELESTRMLVLPAIDTAKALSEDMTQPKDSPAPWRYALGHAVSGFGSDAAKSKGGSWSTLPDGRALWQLEVDAPGAVSLDFGFTDFRLPAGAELWVIDRVGGTAQGPFTDAVNKPHGQFWTPILRTDKARLEIVVPVAKRALLRFNLDTVHQGYRDLFATSAGAKSGSCNVDVVCPEGDDWRDEIRAAAVVAYNDGGTREGNGCSGQFVNSTGASGRPLFLSANHCRIEGESARVYFNFQNSTCRTAGSVPSGENGDGPLNVSMFGAHVLAQTDPAGGVVSSDFALLRFDDPPPAAANLFLSGWDRRNLAPAAVTAIHHPQGDEKRISFENDPLSITAYSEDIAGGNTHLRVADWDLGTTEQGSSGSGIWNDAGHLVGVLSGGAAACGNNESDWYGRLAHAWDGLGSPATRVRDWLDPTGTNAQTLDGEDACLLGSTALDSPAFDTSPVAGTTVTFTAGASGGNGNNTYFWDVDGDGTIDRQGPQSSISLSYPTTGSFQVSVSVQDSAGCFGAASRALDVVGASLNASAAAPQQVCGDNDTVMEPGERWRIPVTLSNDGGAALPAGGRALFSPSVVSTAALATADLEGNGFGALDDARTDAPIVLGGDGLKLYGQTFSQAFMSTNGYVSFNPSETGGDWSNGCGGGADNGAATPQLRPLHDDLKVSGNSGAGLRYAYFGSCPRAPDAGPATQGCHVFQWSRMLWVNSEAVSESSGDAGFQAIVYQPSGEIVYQYLNADTHAGGQATIGLIGGAGADPLDVACNTPNAAPTGRAICLFDPAALPPGGAAGLAFGPNTYGYRGTSNAAGSCPFAPIDLAATTTSSSVRIESATAPVSALAPAQSVTVNVPIAIPTDAVCGARIAIDYLGTAAPGGFSVADKNVLDTTLGAVGACQTSNACAAQVPTIAMRRGLYANPARGGNGLANFVYGSNYGGAWYTALADRTPTWYILAGPYSDNLGAIPITRVRNSAAPDGFATVSDQVGRAWVAQIDADSLLFAYAFDDGPNGAELMDAQTLPFSSPNRTQLWSGTPSGWGLVVETLAPGPGSVLDVIGTYFYDSEGTARWVTGSTDNVTSGGLALSAYRVHCPACPRFTDWAATPLDAGTMTRSYTGPSSGTMSTNIVLPAPMSGSWNRSNVPMQALAPPSPAR